MPHRTLRQLWAYVGRYEGEPFEDVLTVDRRALVAWDKDRLLRLYPVVAAIRGVFDCRVHILHFDTYEPFDLHAERPKRAPNRSPSKSGILRVGSRVSEVFCVICEREGAEVLCDYHGLPLAMPDWLKLKPVAVKLGLEGVKFEVRRFYKPKIWPIDTVDSEWQIANLRTEP